MSYLEFTVLIYLIISYIDNFDPAGQQKIKLAEFMQQYVLDETR